MAKKKVKKRPAQKSKRKIVARKRPAARKPMTEPAETQVFQQCGQACPQNLGSGGSHRGACSLDVGHITSHKCSVDGFEWA
jgi:hypothetical protein